MANSPNPGNQDNNHTSESNASNLPRRPRRRRSFWLWFLVLLSGVGGGLIWGWIFIHRQLSPLVEEAIAGIMDRPLELGEVESFSLSGIRFGPTTVPSTQTDPDQAGVDAVVVRFGNLFKLLTEQTLFLDITLVNPQAYIEQNAQGGWITIPPPPEEKDRPIEIKLHRIYFKQADVTLVPWLKGQKKLAKPIKLDVSPGEVFLFDDHRHIQFQLAGDFLKTKGEFELDGEYFVRKRLAQLNVVGSQLQAQTIGKLLPLPLELQKGVIKADLGVELQGTKLQQLNGEVNLKDVSAKLAPVPQPLTQTNGEAKLKGTEISSMSAQETCAAGGGRRDVMSCI